MHKNQAIRMSISIHAPHEGERPWLGFFCKENAYFNPRSPRGGATRKAAYIVWRQRISIHAPHEGERRWPRRLAENSMYLFQSTLPTRGSDYLSTDDPVLMPDFNPRSPRGGATCRPASLPFMLLFQSTLPTRGSDRIRD